MTRNSYEMVPTDSLTPSGYNPNEMSPEEYVALVNEVRVRGALQKPIVARNGPAIPYEIIDGEHNWRAAGEVGLTEVPVELVEADDFEARRQSLVRNRTGRKDNLKLGRQYRHMLALSGLSNRELGEILQISEGSVRNQLLYPECWELLRLKGERGMTESGAPIEPECYLWHANIYTEQTITKYPVRALRALVTRLQGLVDEGEEGAAKPGAAEPEARIIAGLKRAWAKATEDERRAFIDWTGVSADIEQLVKDAHTRGFNEGKELAENPFRRDPNEPPAGEPTKRRKGPKGYRRYQLGGGFTLDVPEETVQSEPAAKAETPSRSRKDELASLLTSRANAALARRLKAERGTSSVEPAATTRNGYAARGARIREARKALGLTAKELAKRAGIVPNLVSMVELGRLTKSGGPAAGRPAFAKLEAVLGIAS
jgi:ParB-like chromosome segregation protein Spo0J/ribosome-binding protein aMBF1 (putative translation factor)